MWNNRIGVGMNCLGTPVPPGGGGTAFPALGVQIHPDVTGVYPTGSFTGLDPLRVIIWKLYNSFPGTFNNPLYPDSRGSNGHVMLGSQYNTGSAEDVPGLNYIIDHSAPNEALVRWSASAATNKNIGAAYGPNPSTPGVPSNQWVGDLIAIDVAHATGAKIGGIMRGGVQLTSTVTQTGVAWDAVTPIGLSQEPFYINANTNGLGGSVTQPGEEWASQTAMWFLDAPTMASLINSDGTFKADAYARFFTVGVGPKDLNSDGSGPGIGLPAVYHELRAAETIDKYFINKGTLGINPTLIGANLTSLRRVFRAPIDPVPSITRPYRKGPWTMLGVSDTNLNDTTGTYPIPSGFGQPIIAGKTLIMVIVNMGYDAGGLRNPTMVDQHSVAYTLVKHIAGTFGETSVFTKLADANDATGANLEWANTPTVNWTPGGGFGDGHASVSVALFEGPTAPLVQDAQGAAKAGATTGTGYVCDSVTSTTNQALMLSIIGCLDMAFEGNIGLPSTMDLSLKRSDVNKAGGWAYVGEENIAAIGATGTRTFSASASGNAFREISLLLQNS